MPTALITPAQQIIFNEALESYSPIFRDVCYSITGAQGYTDLGWLGAPTGLEPYTGTPNIQLAVNEYHHIVRTNKWERTLALGNTPGRTIDDAAIARATQDLAYEVAQQFDRDVMTMLVNGTSSTATFDGTAFFANSRSAPFAAIDNIVSATGVTITTLAADLSSAITQMSLFKADNGDTYINSTDGGWIIVAPMALKSVFEYLLNAQTISGTTNLNTSKNFRLITSPVLDAASTSNWYLLKVDNNVRRPLMYVETSQVIQNSFDRLNPTDLASPSGVQVYCDYTFAYGDFRKAVRVA